MRELRRLAGMAVALAGVACTDNIGTEQAVTSPAGPERSISSASAPAHSANAGGAQATFHARNHFDWVGKAHNKALDDFAAMISMKGPAANFCAELLDFMSDVGRVPAGRGEASRDERRAAAIRGLRTTGACRAQFARVRSFGGWLATTRSMISTSSAEEVSAEAQTLLNQIAVAQSGTPSAGELAASLIPILSAADLLVSAEREIVYAVASVAQSSTEYWEASLEPLVDQVDVSYGACLGQYYEKAYALSACMGIEFDGIVPTLYEGSGKLGGILATQVQTDCNKYSSKPKIVYKDIGGAVSGGALGFAIGSLIPAAGSTLGTVWGVINGAGSASAAESWGQAAEVVHCRRTGGGGAGEKIQQT